MYLKLITPQPQDIGTFDRSGLWINAREGGYEVTSVAKGSAGAAAGLAVGDVITAIEGKPVRVEHQSDARQMLRDLPAGTKISLMVRHEKESRVLTLTLQDQI